MKKIVLFITLLFIAQLFFGQEEISNEKIQIGIPYPVVDASSKQYFRYKDLILGVKVRDRRGGVTYTLQTYSSNKLTLEKLKIYDDFPKWFVQESIIKLNDRIFLFFSVWDKPRGVEQLFVREFDVENASFKDAPKLILEVDGKVAGTSMNYRVYNKYDFYTSFDESKLLIQYRRKPKTKKDSKNKDVIGYKVFDGNIELLHGSEVEMPYTEKKMNNLDYAVDNSGDFYIAAKVYRDNSTKNNVTKKTVGYDKKEINYDIEIMTVSADGVFSQKKIELESGKHISSLRLFEAGDGRIISAGYYSSGGKKGNDFSDVNGVFKFNLTKGDDAFRIDYYDIPLEIINQNRREKAVKKSKKKEKEKEGGVALSNLDPKTFFIHSDGSIVLIGEQFYITTHTYTDSKGNTRTTTTYHYNDVLITKINKDGSLAYMKKMAKRQTNGLSSFKLVEGKDDLYLIYRDNIRNLELDLVDVPARGGKFLTAYKINYNTGETSKISLFDYRVVKGLKIYQFALSRIISTTDDEFVFEVYKKKKEDILIKVELK
ncbi:MAG: hypothetical protein JKX68_05810 [Flavobacteriales bacterium]|nr:hypothetical protein [Flavobacteriales bacterium]